MLGREKAYVACPCSGTSTTIARSSSNILIAEQEELAAALSQLVVEEGFVIGLPQDLGDIKIGWNARLVAEPLQILSFERLTFYPRP